MRISRSQVQQKAIQENRQTRGSERHMEIPARNYLTRASAVAASMPDQSSMPPCSGLSRPSPSGGREDAASLDSPSARRLLNLWSGRKNARGAGRTKEWT